MTVEVKDKRQLERVVSAIRRISGVRDIETSESVNAPEPEHIAISKSKGIKIDWKDGHHSEYDTGLPARRVSLRHLHRRPRNPAAEDQLRSTDPRNFSDVQAQAQDVERRSRWAATRFAWTGATATTRAFIRSTICGRICPCDECSARADFSPRGALSPAKLFARDYRRHRTAAERLPVERRIAALRERLIHVVGPLASVEKMVTSAGAP